MMDFKFGFDRLDDVKQELRNKMFEDIGRILNKIEINSGVRDALGDILEKVNSKNAFDGKSPPLDEGSNRFGGYPVHIIPASPYCDQGISDTLIVFCFDKDNLGARLQEMINTVTKSDYRINKVIFVTTHWSHKEFSKLEDMYFHLRKKDTEIVTILMTDYGATLIPLF